MATQPSQSTYASHNPYTPKPNIRVAFLSGPSQATVAGELAKLPEAQQTATLEELEIAGLARDVVELAKTHLSPAMYPAFLRWAETAAHLATTYGDDDKAGEQRYATAIAACAAVHAIPSVSPSDYTFKTHLVELQNNADSGELGPLGEGGSFNWSSDPSSVIKAIEVLAERAFALSDSRVAFSVVIGTAVRQVFLDAMAVPAVSRPEMDDAMPLRALLIERNAIIARLNDGPDLSEDASADACDEMNRLDAMITKSPAMTADDAVVKLLVVTQISAEGHEVSDVEAAQAVIEARKHFGIGYIHAGFAQSGAPAPIILPPGYDPYLRDAYIRWQEAYAAFVAARLERRVDEKGAFHEACVRFIEGRTAETEAAHEAAQTRFEGLANAEYEALQALVRCTAPGPAELAIKLTLFNDYEMSNDEGQARLLDVLEADARRFGKHGASLQADKVLLDAYAGLRREKQLWLDRGPQTPEEDDAGDVRVTALEDIFFAQRAHTIEGVIAKLRNVFTHINQDAWTDHAAVDPEHAEFREGMQQAGTFDRAYWSVVEDLARIGGVNLSEMGA